jgi:peptidoglycan hydrolase-like protein with peptidoglycan-binding domain
MAELPPTLKLGSKGEAVKGLQNALTGRSPYGVAIDGEFGSETENAVKQFQGSAGLEADGVVGPRTWGELYVYVVQRGDTLSEIADDQLGNADRWNDLHELNKALISDPDKIHPGQVLVLPIYAH